MKTRRAFTLNEMLITLGLIVVVMEIGGRVIRSSMMAGHNNLHMTNQAAQIDSAVRQLRADTWSAKSIRLINARQVQLTRPDRTSIDWSVDAQGDVRRDDHQSPRIWPEIGLGWEMTSPGDSVVLTDRRGPYPQPLVLESQILIAGQGARP